MIIFVEVFPHFFSWLEEEDYIIKSPMKRIHKVKTAVIVKDTIPDEKIKILKVEITKEALQDMEDIYNYIAIDLLAPDNAMGQYNRIADEILTLDTFPERFRIMDSEPEKRMELRRMLVDNYSVFYTIRDERVIVTDVLYTASDIEARLRGEL